MRNKRIDVKKLLERIDSKSVWYSLARFKETSGKNHMTNCPFHKDNNPSMQVDVENGWYSCFSCGAKGNTINFIMKVLNKTFPEALFYLINTLQDYQKEDLFNSGYEVVKQVKKWTVLDLFDADNFSGGLTLTQVRNNIRIQKRLDQERESNRTTYIGSEELDPYKTDSYFDLKGRPCSKEESAEIDLQIIEEYFKESFRKFKKFVDITTSHNYLRLHVQSQTLVDHPYRHVPKIMFKALEYLKSRFEYPDTMLRSGCFVDTGEYFASINENLTIFEDHINEINGEQVSVGKYRSLDINSFAYPPSYDENRNKWYRLIKLGLLRYEYSQTGDRKRRYYPTFYNRIVFPVYAFYDKDNNLITDIAKSGKFKMRIAGFTGRTIADETYRIGGDVKWLHIQNSDYFQRGKTIFNSHHACWQFVDKNQLSFSKDVEKPIFNKYSQEFYRIYHPSKVECSYEDIARDMSTVFIGEGPWDALALTEIQYFNQDREERTYQRPDTLSSIGTLGAKVNKNQIQLLNDLFSVKYIVFDSDFSGNVSGYDLYKRLNEDNYKRLVSRFGDLYLSKNTSEMNLNEVFSIFNEYSKHKVYLFDWSSLHTESKDIADVLYNPAERQINQVVLNEQLGGKNREPYSNKILYKNAVKQILKEALAIYSSGVPVTKSKFLSLIDGVVASLYLPHELTMPKLFVANLIKSRNGADKSMQSVNAVRHLQDILFNKSNRGIRMKKKLYSRLINRMPFNETPNTKAVETRYSVNNSSSINYTKYQEYISSKATYYKILGYDQIDFGCKRINNMVHSFISHCEIDKPIEVSDFQYMINIKRLEKEDYLRRHKKAINKTELSERDYISMDIMDIYHESQVLKTHYFFDTIITNINNKLPVLSLADQPEMTIIRNRIKSGKEKVLRHLELLRDLDKGSNSFYLFYQMNNKIFINTYDRYKNIGVNGLTIKDEQCLDEIKKFKIKVMQNYLQLHKLNTNMADCIFNIEYNIKNKEDKPYISILNNSMQQIIKNKKNPIFRKFRFERLINENPLYAFDKIIIKIRNLDKKNV